MRVRIKGKVYDLPPVEFTVDDKALRDGLARVAKLKRAYVRGQRWRCDRAKHQEIFTGPSWAI
jgi:hypothetical protein